MCSGVDVKVVIVGWKDIQPVPIVRSEQIDFGSEGMLLTSWIHRSL